MANIVFECYGMSCYLSCKLHSLLLLSLVAKPHPDHVLFQVELLRYCSDLLAAGPRLHGKVGFKASLLRRSDGRPLPLLLPVRQQAPVAVLGHGVKEGARSRGDRFESDRTRRMI